MSTTHENLLRRALGRGTLTVVGSAAGFALVATTFSAVTGIWRAATRPWGRVLPVSSMPASTPPTLPGLAESAQASINQVWISTTDPLPTAQALDAASLLLPHLTGIVASVLALVLVRRLWIGRPFSRLLTVGLGILSALMLLTAFGQPALHGAGTSVGYEALHWPTHHDRASLPPDALLVVTLPWFTQVNWVLVTVGLLLGGLAVLLRRGEAQQHTVEGLV